MVMFTGIIVGTGKLGMVMFMGVRTGTGTLGKVTFTGVQTGSCTGMVTDPVTGSFVQSLPQNPTTLTLGTCSRSTLYNRAILNSMGFYVGSSSCMTFHWLFCVQNQ